MRISIITSARADFGLLKNLILEIKKEKKFLTSVIASGSHYTKQFGDTSKEIIKNKIKIDKKILFRSISDNENSISKIFGKCVDNVKKIFRKCFTSIFQGPL